MNISQYLSTILKRYKERHRYFTGLKYNDTLDMIDIYNLSIYVRNKVIRRVYFD